MSSIFKVSEEVYTVVSSGSLDMLLDSMSEQLEPLNPKLADFLRRRRTLYTTEQDERYVEELKDPDSWNFTDGYCVLTTLSSEELQLVYEAMERVFDVIALLEPSYPLFLAHTCTRCKALVRLDPRLRYDQRAVLRIKVNENSIWKGADWVGDVIVEHLTAQATEFMDYQEEPVQVTEEERSLIRTLLAGRSWHRQEWKDPNLALDMSEFTTEQIERLLPKVEWLGQRELVTGRHSYWRPDFTPQQAELLFDSIATFVENYTSDERVHRRIGG